MREANICIYACLVASLLPYEEDQEAVKVMIVQGLDPNRVGRLLPQLDGTGESYLKVIDLSRFRVQRLLVRSAAEQ